MKKLLHLSAFLLLISFSAFPQGRTPWNGTQEDNGFLNLRGHSQNPDDLSGFISFKPEFPLNDDYLLVQKHDLEWDFPQSVWEHTLNEIYTYDSSNNPVEKLRSWTDGSGPYEKTVCFYDVNQNLDEERIYQHNGSEWINYYKYLYNYDVNNNRIQRVRQGWDGDVYVNEVKDIYGYNANNQKISSMQYYWVDGEWTESEKAVYQYDGNDNLFSIITEGWIDNNWVNNQKSIYSWDTTGLLISIYVSDWDTGHSVWFAPGHNQLYTYDLHNNRISFVRQHYYEDDEIWINDYKSIYYYLPVKSETVENKKSGINKIITDFQTTEDDITIVPKGKSKVLIGIEVVIDTVFHTSVGDLEFTLTHNGISQKIIDKVGGDGDHFLGTKLSDYGVDTLIHGIAPFHGIYKHGNPLSLFTGTDPAGKWTLSIYDATAGNTGELRSWGLNLIYASGNTSVNESDENRSFEIFPNPAKDLFEVRGWNFERSPITFELFDLMGRKILRNQYPAGTSTFIVDVSGIQSGEYLCRLRSEKSIATQKVIILK